MTTPGNRLRAAREKSGFKTAKDAALDMGIAIATYTQHEHAATHLPGRRAAQYAARFGVSPEYLLYGRGEVPDRIPVLDEYGQHTGHTVAIPVSATDHTRAVEGDIGKPLGLVAIYNDPPPGPPTADCHGRLCVVGCFSGPGHTHRLIRVVQPGSTPLRFHLIAPGVLPLVDHEVLWIAPVVALVPA